ncbi:MAG: thiamine diphosphokinase [Chloroflexi bacterium]|nr:thiamine diphosphokinase [Chloroflexota bacterium]
MEQTERLLAIVDSADRVLAADGGANWLAAHGRLPHVLIGDMDSVHPDVLRALAMGDCRLVRHPAQKDETDTELALNEALGLGAQRITLLGAWGGRMDHALANVLLLAMPQLAKLDVALFDGCSTVRLVRRALTLSGAPGDLLSLLPLAGEARGVTTEGLQYALSDDTLPFGPARGVSNVFTGALARVNVRSGLLLAVHTPLAWLEQPA